jgi:hypothetical protein
MVAIQWVTIASLATAFGTLVLAIATFASVRSANRAARVSEQAFLHGQQPLLFPSHYDDRVQKVGWVDEHRTVLHGGRAAAEIEGDVVYLAASLRNVGNGIAVLQGWRATAERVTSEITMPDPSSFRDQTRDLYVPSNEIGFWQGAFRDPNEPGADEMRRAVSTRTPFTVELLYSDHEGGQRAIGRFFLTPTEAEDRSWLISMVRHWNLDRPNPR